MFNKHRPDAVHPAERRLNRSIVTRSTMGLVCFIPLLLLASQARANIVSNGNFGNLNVAAPTNGVCTTNPALYPVVDPGDYPACTATGWSGNYQIGNGQAVGVYGVSFGIPQPDPSGRNALILQAEYNVPPTATESITLPSNGEYVLSFYAANRTVANAGPQTISVLLDNSLISGGTFGNLPGTWTLETLDFSATAGVHSFTLEGLDETSGSVADNVSAFVNDVSIVPFSMSTSTPEPSSVAMIGLGLCVVSILMGRRFRS